MGGLELLTTEEMARADKLAVKAGVDSLTLMENAGRAVAAEAARMVDRGARVLVLCGPGNNGGDGFVAARHLAEAGFDTSVALLGPRDALKGDAAAMARRWSGRVEPLAFATLDGANLVVDALFGAGLSRPLEGPAAGIVDALGKSGCAHPLDRCPERARRRHGRGGRARRPRGSHRHLLPAQARSSAHAGARADAGTTIVAQIGIPKTVLGEIRPQTWANAPGLWLDQFPHPAP